MFFTEEATTVEDLDFAYCGIDSENDDDGDEKSSDSDDSEEYSDSEDIPKERSSIEAKYSWDTWKKIFEMDDRDLDFRKTIKHRYKKLRDRQEITRYENFTQYVVRNVK